MFSPPKKILKSQHICDFFPHTLKSYVCTTIFIPPGTNNYDVIVYGYDDYFYGDISFLITVCLPWPAMPWRSAGGPGAEARATGDRDVRPHQERQPRRHPDRCGPAIASGIVGAKRGTKAPVGVSDRFGFFTRMDFQTDWPSPPPTVAGHPDRHPPALPPLPLRTLGMSRLVHNPAFINSIVFGG